MKKTPRATKPKHHPTTEEYQEQMRFNQCVQDYKNKLSCYVMTTRFNNETYNENQSFRERRPKIKCIYGTPRQVAQHIPIDTKLTVIEMNNDCNTITGIGLVINHPICNKYVVYNNGNYNRYAYAGNHRIDRTEFTPDEMAIIKVFEILCFTGNRHMKRGQGLTCFPIDILYRCSIKIDLVNFIREMFKRRFEL